MMKNFYSTFLLLTGLVVGITGYSQVDPPCMVPLATMCDNIDSYVADDPLGPGASWWTTWSGTEGGAEDGIVSDDYAYSGSNSALIPEGGTTDVILKLGNQTTGTWKLEWWMYVPDLQSAYYNIQESETPGLGWNMEVYFGDVTYGEGQFTVPVGPTFTYPVGEWFLVQHIINLDDNTIQVYIDEVLTLDGEYLGNLGSIDFYSALADNHYYIDDVLLTDVLYEPCAIPDATLCDNIDTYTAGEAIGPFAEWWTTWSGTEGGAEDGTVTDEQAFAGPNSMLIPEGGVTDVILKLGNLTTGTWNLEWQMYVPDTKSAYYNIQESETPGVGWNMEVYFGDVTSGEGEFTVPVGPTFTYPVDEWFLVKHVINLDDNTIQVYIDGVLTLDGEYLGSIGGIDFYSSSGINRYYVDDVLLIEELAAEPCAIPGAILCDNIDTYTAGEAIGPFADWWTTWSGTEGGAEDGTVSDEHANSGTNSMLIPEGGVTDVILKLGNLSTGNYLLEWQMYVPAGKHAYYNIQESETPGVAWNLELQFGIDAAGEGVFSVPADGPTFTYPEDGWFLIQHYIDLDANLIVVNINGVAALGAPYTGNIGGIDFYSIDGSNRYHIDDVLLIESDVTISTYYADSDGDSFGDAAVTAIVIGDAPTGYVANSDDCDDTDENVYPGATEITNGIDDDCDGLTDENVGVNNITSLNAIHIYPVPSAGQFTLELSAVATGEVLQLEIVNSFGQLIYSDEVVLSGMNITKSINLEDYASGVYQLQLISGNSVITKQVVIQR